MKRRFSLAISVALLDDGKWAIVSTGPTHFTMESREDSGDHFVVFK